jgi:TonB family protein
MKRCSNGRFEADTRTAVNHPSPPDGLFAQAPRRARSWAAVTTSAVMHVLAIAAILYVARDAMSANLPRAPRGLTFVSVLSAPDPALVVPLEPLHLRALERVPEDSKPAEPVPPKIDVPIPEPPVVSVPKMPIPEPRREKPVAIEPVKPAPVVTVGTFAASVPAAHTSEPVRSVQQAGFDAPAARAPEIKVGSAAVGTFDQPSAAVRPQAGSDRPTVVADAGFGTATARPASPAAARGVVEAGFGGPGEPATARPQPQAVRATGFDARPAPPTPPPAAREPRIDVPLEILSKPTPAYTEEARTLKIEGDVVLEVNFAATGEIRVLRVVRGLGHGLDESATRAAQGMRFKPAQSGGHPIDFRTTVHIVFRVA